MGAGAYHHHIRPLFPVLIGENRWKAIASISISGPSNRITTYYMKNVLVDIIIGVAGRISRKLSYNDLQ
jgi:hypothetical protein